ncbi:MAG TPA: SPOR domain-containing protein [Gemmatimonadales bacterium]|nr:SPOR domain-containing protein [Gemmatimonadales bacterium]
MIRFPGVCFSLVAGLALAAPSLRAQVNSAAVQRVDSIRRAAIGLAQTRPDSARAMIRRLLTTLSPRDSMYPAALLDAGRFAADAPTVATNLQRVVVEYGRSVWADSALLLLTQLYFAQGDPAATLQAADRMRRDYPDSPLRARTSFWAARAYFDLKDDTRGCAMVQEALTRAGDDLEFQNQVNYYQARCRHAPAGAPVPTPPQPVSGAANPAPTGGGSAASAAAATPGDDGKYAVQVLAVKSAPQVDDVLTRLKAMGYDARVVRDTSGLFKVRVGRYTTRVDADRMQKTLKTRLGGQPFVVEEP